MPAVGISQLLALTQAIGALATTLGAVAADKKVDLRDLGHLPEALRNLNQFVRVEYKELKSELEDLNGEETDQLEQEFRKSFHLEDLSKEEVIEKGFSTLLATLEALRTLMAIQAKISG